MSFFTFRVQPQLFRTSGHTFGSFFLFLLLTTACGVDPSEDEGEFFSHVPGVSEYGDSEGNTGAEGDINADASGSPAERAISEADIIQMEGDLLYALSRYSGLSIIDITDASNLRLLGNYRSSAIPFEMYLDAGVAYIMYNGWYSYEYDESTDLYSWESTSRMQAIDVSNPNDLTLIGDSEVPGEIIDSRKVGDVLYLATHQNGYCWRCDEVDNTRVTSFNVSNPTNFSPVDSVTFENEDWSWKRSISVTDKRIYISNWTWSGNGNDTGSIDVVDITDPQGDLKKGTTINVAGQIENRWQMNEFEGTLRVISQPGGWGTTTPPVVETFKVSSADEITKLASLEVVLPRPEDLRSVRFDGDRAFAITFERTDPLFTFDLSDPKNPLQVGELEIPGWVYHMEPRGDRLYALGFDNDNAEGSLNVSLFDVSDLKDPTMMKRVNFGGDWGSFAEDQDRVHKAFNIHSDEGLIFVPYFGGEYDELSCKYEYQSGIQIIDMNEDTLALRGVAPQEGSARRALFHNGTLFGISDNAVQSFDITNIDSPLQVDQLDMAHNVTNIKVMGDTILRFGNDWWTDQTILDFVKINGAETAEGLGKLDLASVVGQNETSCNFQDGEYYYTNESWGGQVFVHGDYAYVPRYGYVDKNINGKWSSSSTLTFYIVDISNRAKPTIVGSFAMDSTSADLYSHYSGIVQTESALLVGRSSGYYSYDQHTGERNDVKFSYDIIDLSNPLNPQVVERFSVPKTLAQGGWGYGVHECTVDVGWGWWNGYYDSQNALVSGDIVVSQHEEAVKDGTGRVRYYLDRINVSDPKNPELMPKVNIPGNVVHFDANAERIVTIDYILEQKSAKDWDECYDGDDSYYDSYFDEEDHICRSYRRRLNVLSLDGARAVLVDSFEIDEKTRANSIAISNNYVFYNTYEWGHGSISPRQTVNVLTYERNGKITELASVELEQNGYWGGTLVARDGRAFMTGNNELIVIDTQGSKIEAARHEMGGWRCNELEVQADVAYCAMGPYGVKSIPLK